METWDYWGSLVHSVNTSEKIYSDGVAEGSLLRARPRGTGKWAPRQILSSAVSNTLIRMDR